MPRSRHSRVTFPRLNANVISTIAAVTAVTARRVSASPGCAGDVCETEAVGVVTIHPSLGTRVQEGPRAKLPDRSAAHERERLPAGRPVLPPRGIRAAEAPESLAT